ncbi:aminoglycoside phosphotransferase family protein [Nocardiopsis halotolerans]|uniref:aminoglycoside phosphotransferase family protein n=1 Tax=Nocardiopsis halotolerans TaxID=124252 RepID=UPI00034DE25E|nr:aminoglycoside phosphotransferase family protein [Nocardiopsis halotolerans]
MHDDTHHIRVPEELAHSLTRFFGPAWTRALPGLAQHQLRRWNLRPAAPPLHGAVSLVIPVHRADGRQAMLKVLPIDDESEGEPHALRTWAGDGAVRLLQHDPTNGAMLLEALDPTRNLNTLEIDQALTTIGLLLSRLTSHPAPHGMRDLETITHTLVQRAQHLTPRLRSAHERDQLTNLAAHAHDMAPEAGNQLLHWDLHFENVLAPLPGTDREPWLAIDPKPLAGDPGFDLLPILHNRWEETLATGDPHRETRRRLDLVSEAAGIPRDRAHAWTLVRTLQECVWRIEDGTTTLPDVPMTITEALTR